MKSIFDHANREELIQRVNSLSLTGKADWGKMNVYQMTTHCTIWNDWVLGRSNQTLRQGLLGKIFGKMALRSNTKDDKPLGKNMPAGKLFTVIATAGNLDAQKATLSNQIAEYENFSNDGFIHDFFGKMTKEEIGIFAYKHSDHHLRQFGV
ncbi:MAG: DUF1569 domain-containing protein [Chryseolinea sp.]